MAEIRIVQQNCSQKRSQFHQEKSSAVRQRLPRKFEISPNSGENYILRARFKSYRCTKVPNRSDQLAKNAKTRARSLYDNFLTQKATCILIDDETYLKCDFNQLPGQKFYFSTLPGNVPKDYKHICIDNMGRS